MNTGVEAQSEPGARAAAEPALAVSGLRRDYGERTVLRGITFELEPGRTLGVIGPNGAGKSTLLRILATLLRPSGGEVRVLGSELPRQAWKARGRIGYLGHQPLLYRELSVRENLEFNARLQGVERPGERIADLLERAGLTRRAGELVRNLSAGMAQRAAICRALLHDPELLLLDEPRSHLDVAAATEVEQMLAAGPNRSRVLVTHDVEQGLRESDTVLALGANGSVAFLGDAGAITPAEAQNLFGGRQ